jgi:hypothetical protein
MGDAGENRIRTWTDLRDHVTATYGQVPGVNPSFVRFPFAHGDASFTIGAFELRSRGGRGWVALAVKICDVNRIRPNAALLKNVELAVGAFGMVADHLTIRQTLPIDGLRPAQIASTLRELVATAKHVQDALERPDDEHNSFGYLAR